METIYGIQEEFSNCRKYVIQRFSLLTLQSRKNKYLSGKAREFSYTEMQFKYPQHTHTHTSTLTDIQYLMSNMLENYLIVTGIELENI